uniref:Gypsy retrotransposon integrase-like protein 1 n=1 Tax=Leptobrachium leishanense TaxID=445787 RepID=A0A8C5P854_9ANUR
MILTDHKNLTFIADAKRLSSRQARWSMFLTHFNYIITYRPGNRNAKADALSRQFEVTEQQDRPVESIVPLERVVAATHLTLTSTLLTRIQAMQSTAPPETPSDKLFVPDAERKELLSCYHASRPAGHPGIKRTLSALTPMYWWPDIAKDVREYVQACVVCAQSKASTQCPAGLLQPLAIPDKPWSHISMDFIVDLPPSEGHTVILTIVDRFTKMVHLVPLKKLPTSKGLANIFAKEVFRLHGLPHEIVSDRGPQFISRFWRNFCSQLGIKVSFSSAYHPQSNGAAERANQSSENYIRSFSSQGQDDWVSLLPWAEFALNSNVNASSGHSPFYVAHGFQPTFLPSPSADTGLPDLDSYVQSLHKVWTLVRSNLCHAAVQQKTYADRHRRMGPSYVPGQRVWLSTRNIKLRVPSMKFAPRYIGPFKVLRRINEVSYALDLPHTLRIPNTFHTSLLKPLLCNRFTTVIPRPRPVLVQGQEEFEVQSIVDSRHSRGGLQYLVHWRGYGPEERSWVHTSDLHAPRLVRAFHRSHPTAPGSRRPEGARGGGVLSCLLLLLQYGLPNREGA